MKSIVFDLDGTLIDSAPDLRIAANTVLATQGDYAITLEQARSFIGHGARVFVDKMIAAVGLQADDARREDLQAHFMELYLTAVNETLLYPGAADALAHFRAQGWRIGLCTNKPSGPTRAVLARFDLLDQFDAVIGGDMLPESKPHPAPLLAAVKALGGHPALYVGDSEVDAETAERAALPFALYSEGYSKVPVAELPHDALFSDFAQLPEIAERLLARQTA